MLPNLTDAHGLECPSISKWALESEGVVGRAGRATNKDAAPLHTRGLVVVLLAESQVE